MTQFPIDDPVAEAKLVRAGMIAQGLQYVIIADEEEDPNPPHPEEIQIAFTPDELVPHAEETLRARQRMVEGLTYLTPEQKEIVWGSYVVRYFREADLEVFGYIYTEEELYAIEKRAGATDQEAALSVERARRAYQRGQRYGLWFSTNIRDGEPGFNYVGKCAGPITKDDFDAARSNGWRLTEASKERLSSEIAHKVWKEILDEEARRDRDE